MLEPSWGDAKQIARRLHIVVIDDHYHDDVDDDDDEDGDDDDDNYNNADTDLDATNVRKQSIFCVVILQAFQQEGDFCLDCASCHIILSYCDNQNFIIIYDHHMVTW